MVDDRTQQTDRPGRKVLTGIAIAACGGVIALLVEYLVLQVWLAPETKPWKSNDALKAVGGIAAHGDVEHTDVGFTVTGVLQDKAHDNKGVLLIFTANGEEALRVANTDGANHSVDIGEVFPNTAKDIAVQECLTDQQKAADVKECSDPLRIWP